MISYGGILVRCMDAINGFKRKYDIWPSCLYLSPEEHYVLITHHLTLEGYLRLCDFLDVISQVKTNIKTTGSNNRLFDYVMENGFDERGQNKSIQEVLGFY